MIIRHRMPQEWQSVSEPWEWVDSGEGGAIEKSDYFEWFETRINSAEGGLYKYAVKRDYYIVMDYKIEI